MPTLRAASCRASQRVSPNLSSRWTAALTPCSSGAPKCGVPRLTSCSGRCAAGASPVLATTGAIGQTLNVSRRTVTAGRDFGTFGPWAHGAGPSASGRRRPGEGGMVADSVSAETCRPRTPTTTEGAAARAVALADVALADVALADVALADVAHAVGPQPWKRFLLPPASLLWRARRGESGFSVDPPEDPLPRYALFGVRSCDLAAIAVQDRVLATSAHPDSGYRGRRARSFVVAADCATPAGTCFCSSLGCGPAAAGGYDVALTEVVTGEEHLFLARAGSAAGEAVLPRLPSRPATPHDLDAARAVVGEAAQRMGRRLDPDGLPELLAAHREDPHWNEVAQRCLSCGNCTLVCPTCFCTTVVDATDVTGTVAERRRHWDSCFDLDFSYLHAGSVRASTSARYRHWISHKLGTWPEQFGTAGCVGCGRCITWCPVGIDITAEIAALRGGVPEGGGL